MLLEEGLDARDEVHEHDVKDGEHLERVPDHLAVEVRVVVEHVVGVDVERLPALELEDAVDGAHVLALVHDRVDAAGVARVAEVAEEPEDGGVDVLHADVGAPDEHRRGVGARAAAAAAVGLGGVLVPGLRGERDVVGGHGGGRGRREPPPRPVLPLLPRRRAAGGRAAARVRRRLEPAEGRGRRVRAGGTTPAPPPAAPPRLRRGGVGRRERARRSHIRRRHGCKTKNPNSEIFLTRRKSEERIAVGSYREEGNCRRRRRHRRETPWLPREQREQREREEGIEREEMGKWGVKWREAAAGRWGEWRERGQRFPPSGSGGQR